MPTYSYRCTECENAFDIQQSFTDDTLTDCPVCGGKLRKVFSPVGVTFNGSGFYRTDSRAKSGGSDASSSSSSSDSSSKPAATPASTTSSSSSSASSAAASAAKSASA